MSATTSTVTTAAPELQLDMYRRMLLIRAFEERVLALRIDGRIEGVVHPCIGQEAVAVGACAPLAQTDEITSTHRGHGHCLGKGADPERMMAELFGRRDGYCSGKGGSMHIADFDIGMLGANGIVGGGMPIAAGAALAHALRADEGVALCFFSEGAAGAGPFHEVLNIAAMWKLPLVFLCENNGYAAENPAVLNLSSPDVAPFGEPHGLPHATTDGNDVVAVYETVQLAVDRARAGEGATLVEAKTFRLSGHAFRGPRPEERDPDLIESWRRRDPIVRMRERLLRARILDDARDADLVADVAREIEAAERFAEASPWPDAESALSGLFSETDSNE